MPVYPHCNSAEATTNPLPEEEKLRTKCLSERNNAFKTQPEQSNFVSLFGLFYMAPANDIILVIISVVCAAGTGVCWPLQVAIFGELCNSFIAFSNSVQNDLTLNVSNACQYGFSTNTSLSDAIFDFTMNCGAFHAVLIVQTLIFVTCLNTVAEKQTHRYRNALIKALFTKDVAWYDCRSTEGLASSFSENLLKFQEGIGEKLGILISSISYVFFSFIVAAYHGWKLTLIAMAVFPALTISSGILGKIQTSMADKEAKAYSQAGGMVEEIVSSIKTVVMFGAQDKEIARFRELVRPAMNAGIRRGLAVAIGSCFVWMMTYCGYGLTFWYGIGMILESCDEYDVGSLNVIFFCLLMAAMKMGQIFPLWNTLAQSIAAAREIFKIICLDPVIEGSVGEKPDGIKGRIHFRRVNFAYPSRPNVQVLNGLSFHVEPGETVALVGQSGCGKSTCIQLLQRFYDPSNGKIEIDGFDLRKLDVKYFRNQIGVVGQEPALFNVSIRENIRYGSPEGIHVSQKDIELAALQANAHDFIQKLPRGYDTVVGERGAQLSGGQKQRIAIARALIRRPKILLLDEATSALDSQSESAVQKVLDEARKGRTTIIVAHRLSTVRNADRIIVLNDGIIKEEGKHQTLMKEKGLYYQLVNSQEYQPSKEPLNGICMNESVEEKPIDRTNVSNEAHNRALQSMLLNPASEKNNEDSILCILKWNAPEWHIIALGLIGSAMVGIGTPVYAINYGELMGLFSKGGHENVTAEKNYYSLMFVVVALTTGIGAFLQNFMLSVAGEKLTYRLRLQSFKAILQQEIHWFDMPANSVGSICSRLSNDASAVHGAIGVRLGVIFQVISGIVLGLVISFLCNWKLALVNGFFAPLMIVCGFFGVKISIGEDSVKSKALEQSSSLATEAMSNIRTVKSLGVEEVFRMNYMSSLEDSYKAFIKRAPLRGIIYALTVYGSSTISVFSFAYGGYLIRYEGLAYKEVFKITEALIFGMEMIGQAMAFTPDYGRAKAAAGRIAKLINAPSTQKKEQVELTTMDGSAEFQDVHFHYRTRPDVAVLKGLEFEVPSGKTIALVGLSGCGKSTCIQLLQRFYEPDSGKVCIEKNKDIDNFSVKSYRSFLGVVSQEPVLFNRSIAENIAYGDPTRDVPMNEIIQAATDANIHTFISSLPLGYETKVGQKGVQLSGGQKQRVAIARVLIRNPKMLILDEATSALDVESERAVQEALEEAGKDRTCVVIAHRLITIKDADNIVVMEQGKVIEQGTHEELLRLLGTYYQLWSAQTAPFL